MSDRMLYLRDLYDGEIVTVLLIDNGDGTHTPMVKLGLDSRLAVMDPSAKPVPPAPVKRASKKR